MAVHALQFRIAAAIDDRDHDHDDHDHAHDEDDEDDELLLLEVFGCALGLC